MRKLFILFAAISIATLVNAQINLSQGLQLYLPFNGNAQDASGNNNNGIVNGATLTTDQNNLANSAYSFDGINDNILIADHSSLNPTVYSICAKVKMRGFYNGLCYNNSIVNKGVDLATSTTSHYSLRTTQSLSYSCTFQDTTNHNYRFDVNGNGTVVLADINNTPYVQTNQWDCLVGTFDGSTLNMYVNGVLRYTNDQVLSKPSNTSDLSIGNHIENLAQYPFWFDGVIDEVRIYNRVINIDEINYYCTTPFPESVSNFSEEIKINLTPNPSNNLVSLNLENLKGSGQLEITSIDGKVMLSEKINNKSLEFIDVSQFANGFYFFNIKGQNQHAAIKFLKN